MPSSHDKNSEDKTPEIIEKINNDIKNLNPAGTVKVFSIRGHIFDMDRGMEFIPSSTQIVHMGGCNGYNFVYKCINKANESDFIGTKLRDDAVLQFMIDECRRDRLYYI